MNEYDFQVLLFISLKPREQVSVLGLLDILNRLQSEGLVTVNEMYPGMPDQNIWSVTWKGINFINEWKKDADNRHRLYGLSSPLPHGDTPTILRPR